MALSQRLGWIGVDVGTHTVKLAQAVRDGAEVRLHRAAVIQRRTTWSRDDELALGQPISSYPEIRAGLECGGFSGRDAICSLPMNLCQLRGVNVPPGSDRERRTMIADEISEDWAAHSQPMEFDFWELESGRAEKGSDGFNVSILAASRLWIGQLWRDCRQSGLDCWAVDGAPLAMARAVGLAGAVAGGQRAMAIDWGYSNTTLCVVGDDRPLYSRRIRDCAFGGVIDAIVERFDVTVDEAQYLSETQGLSTEAADGVADMKIQAAISEAAAGPIDELVRHVRRTLQFMESQRRQLHPESIWLMGGGASLRNVGPYLERELRLPVRIWKLPTDGATIECASGARSAAFGAAVALSASAWRAA